VDSTKTSLSVELVVEVVNPTMYESEIPYLEMQYSYHGFVLGSVTIRDYYMKAGRNHIPALVRFSPFELGGSNSVANGIDMIGLYLSDLAPNLTISAFEGSLPSMPLLSKAMSMLNVTLPIPRLPREQDDHAELFRSSGLRIQGSDLLKAATVRMLKHSLILRCTFSPPLRILSFIILSLELQSQ